MLTQDTGKHAFTPPHGRCKAYISIYYVVCIEFAFDEVTFSSLPTVGRDCPRIPDKSLSDFS